MRERFWPTISDVASARQVGERAALVAAIIGGLTALFAILAIAGKPMVPSVDAWNLIDAAVYGGVALGIWRMSRVAAVLGLVLMVLERIVLWSAEVGMTHLLITAILLLAFVNAIRATFAFHRLKVPSPEPLPASVSPK